MPFKDPAKKRIYARNYAKTSGQKIARRKWRSSPKGKQLEARYRASAKGRQARRADWLRREYGISLLDYETMLDAQGGHCALCDRTPEQEKRGLLCVDHCHETGSVRGLLCHSHNRSIGGDTEDSLLRALEYVRHAAKATRTANRT
jgi:hypothetical protein